MGVFKMSFGLVGGTELRLLLALVNLVVLAKPRLAWEGHEVLVFDMIALGATMGVAFTALRSTAQVTKRIYEMERLDYRKDGPMQLVLWAVITLGITLLRLLGELQGWAPAFFSCRPR